MSNEVYIYFLTDDPEEGSNEVYTSLFDLTPKLRRERD